MQFYLRSTVALFYASVSIGELVGDERGETLTSCTLAPLGAPRGLLKNLWENIVVCRNGRLLKRSN